LLARACETADVLLLCGDIVNYGQPDEARLFIGELRAAVEIPVLAVLGNHEHESGRAPEVADIFQEGGIRVLDGDALELRGVGFAGVKGFAGGFGERALQPWGEETIKSFVQEGIDEAVKLDSALAKLRSPRRVVMLHYSPIAATVDGEAREIFPFLGSSRLEEPVNRHAVTAVFHGHAHRGAVEGRTTRGIPVYNAAMPLLQATWPNRAPVVRLDIPVEEAPVSGPALDEPRPRGEGGLGGDAPGPARQ